MGVYKVTSEGPRDDFPPMLRGDIARNYGDHFPYDSVRGPKLTSLCEPAPFFGNLVWRSWCKPRQGGFPEWPKGTDCKSAAQCFRGSNPLPATTTQTERNADGLRFCFNRAQACLQAWLKQKRSGAKRPAFPRPRKLLRRRSRRHQRNKPVLQAQRRRPSEMPGL